MKTILEREAARRTAPSGRLTTDVVEDEAGLHALAPEWEALFSRCLRPSLCATHAWASAWWEAFGENPCGAGLNTRLFVIVVRNAEGELVGVVPFYEELPAGPFRVRRLRILGYLGGGEAFDMTEEPIFLAAQGREAVVLNAVAERLREGLRRGRWDAVHFRIHSSEGAPLGRAFASLRGCAFVTEKSRSGSDYAEIPATWGEYRKAMTKSMRDNLGYYPRLLTRDGHDWAVRTVRDSQALPDAVARLAELHRARARSEKGTLHNDHIQGPAQEAFLARLLGRLAETERGYVAELVIGGEVVASQAFIEAGDQLMVSYSGYREAWSKYSPIFVIDAAVFQEAQARGVRRLDFLRGIAPWKTRWLAQSGPKMHRATLVPYRFASLGRLALHESRALFKRNVRDRLPVLRRRAEARLRELRTKLGEVATSGLCVTNRLGERAAPVAHWATVHHRSVLQLALHRHG